MMWFRMWHEMIHDPKWRVISRKSARPVSEVVAVAVYLMTSASESDERGAYTAPAENIAASLDMDEQHVYDIWEAMEGRFIQDGRIINWEKRQPKREDGSAERAKAWRERKRTQTNASERPEKIREDVDTEEEVEVEREEEEVEKERQNVSQKNDCVSQASKSLPSSEYAFECQHFKITHDQFNRWQQTFKTIDVLHQCRGMRDWYDKQLKEGKLTEEKIKQRWFFQLPQAFAKEDLKRKTSMGGASL